MTNEKITEILDRCKGRFGWVQIHMDTEENYLLMPLADLAELRKAATEAYIRTY